MNGGLAGSVSRRASRCWRYGTRDATEMLGARLARRRSSLGRAGMSAAPARRGNCCTAVQVSPRPGAAWCRGRAPVQVPVGGAGWRVVAGCFGNKLWRRRTAATPTRGGGTPSRAPTWGRWRRLRSDMYAFKRQYAFNGGKICFTINIRIPPQARARCACAALKGVESPRP